MPPLLLLLPLRLVHPRVLQLYAGLGMCHPAGVQTKRTLIDERFCIAGNIHMGRRGSWSYKLCRREVMLHTGLTLMLFHRAMVSLYDLCSMELRSSWGDCSRFSSGHV